MLFKINRIFPAMFNSLQKKIMFTTILLMVMLLLIYASITYWFDSKSIYDQVSEANLVTVEQISNSLDGHIDTLDRISNSFASNPNVIKELRSNSQGNEFNPSQENETMELIKLTLNSWTQIDNLFIYDLNGHSINKTKYDVSLANPRLEDFQNNEVAINYGIKIDQNKDKNGLINSKQKNSDVVVSYVRLIKDPMTQKPLGWVRLDQSLYNLEWFQENNSKTKDRIFIVLEPNGKVVYTNEPESLDILTIAKLLKRTNNSGSMIGLNNGLQSLMSYYTSQNTKWLVVSIVPEQVMNHGLIKVRSFSITIITFEILLSIIVSIFMSKRITRPLRLLYLSMKKVEKGQLQTSVSISSNDEIGELGNQMNSMLQSIDRLIKQVYEQELKKREAQLKALRAQINPHFLYNTLESIDALALKGRPDQVHRIIQALSMMLRYAVNAQKFATVKEELKHVEAYLKIQQIKYPKNLKIRLSIPEEHHNVVIPQLSLQPVVENAFKYGLFRKSGMNFLVIATKQQDSLLEISICDNGVGIEPDQLKEIYSRLNEFEKDRDNGSDRIGLFNVNQRMQLAFGNDFRLKIESKEGYWFKVTISLPMKWEDDKK